MIIVKVRKMLQSSDQNNYRGAQGQGLNEANPGSINDASATVPTLDETQHKVVVVAEEIDR